MDSQKEKLLLGALHHPIRTSTQITPTGPKTFSISFKPSIEVIQGMVDFLMANGATPEEALGLINKKRDEWISSIQSMAARGNNPVGLSSSSSSSWALLIPVGIMAAFALLAFIGVLPVWGMLPVFLFGFSLLFLLWNPKSGATDAIWNEPSSEENNVRSKLDRILAVNQTSFTAYAMQNKRNQFIALAAAAILCIGGTAVGLIVSTVDAGNYHAAITAEGDPRRMTITTGSKFVLYDTESGKYVKKSYLPADYRANTTSEVAGVLIVDTDTKKVGTYGHVGDAYQYVVTISLHDCTSGETIARKVIYGGDPPKTIRTNAFSSLTGRDGYGSKPSSSELEKACRNLIAQYPRK